MVLALGLETFFLGVVYRRYFLDIVDTEWDSPFFVINFLFELVKAAMDFYALWTLLSYFIFIVRERVASLKRKN